MLIKKKSHSSVTGFFVTVAYDSTVYRILYRQD